MTDPVIFKIRPCKGNKYFNVLIFEKRKDMYGFYIEYAKLSGWAARKGSHGAKYGLSKASTYDSNPYFDAIVMPHTILEINENKKQKLRNSIGTMLFFKKRLGAGLVSHEFGHAAFHHQRIILGFNKRNLNLGKTNCVLEEDCLYDLAAMVRKFTNKCYQLGVYK